jgi:hypothetical protein
MMKKWLNRGPVTSHRQLTQWKHRAVTVTAMIKHSSMSLLIEIAWNDRMHPLYAWIAGQSWSARWLSDVCDTRWVSGSS